MAHATIWIELVTSAYFEQYIEWRAECGGRLEPTNFWRPHLSLLIVEEQKSRQVNIGALWLAPGATAPPTATLHATECICK